MTESKEQDRTPVRSSFHHLVSWTLSSPLWHALSQVHTPAWPCRHRAPAGFWSCWAFIQLLPSGKDSKHRKKWWGAWRAGRAGKGGLGTLQLMVRSGDDPPPGREGHRLKYPGSVLSDSLTTSLQCDKLHQRLRISLNTSGRCGSFLPLS